MPSSRVEACLDRGLRRAFENLPQACSRSGRPCPARASSHPPTIPVCLSPSLHHSPPASWPQHCPPQPWGIREGRHLIAGVGFRVVPREVELVGHLDFDVRARRIQPHRVPDHLRTLLEGGGALPVSAPRERCRLSLRNARTGAAIPAYLVPGLQGSATRPPRPRGLASWRESQTPATSSGALSARDLGPNSAAQRKLRTPRDGG